MPKLKLVSADDPATVEQLHWVYFHGEVEEVVENHIYNSLEIECHAPDLIGIAEGKEPKKSGIYDCTVYGVEVKLFYWIVDGHARGLVVKGEDDTAYAQEMYNEKRTHL